MEKKEKEKKRENYRNERSKRLSKYKCSCTAFKNQRTRNIHIQRAQETIIDDRGRMANHADEKRKMKEINRNIYMCVCVFTYTHMYTDVFRSFVSFVRILFIRIPFLCWCWRGKIRHLKITI